VRRGDGFVRWIYLNPIGVPLTGQQCNKDPHVPFAELRSTAPNKCQHLEKDEVSESGLFFGQFSMYGIPETLLRPSQVCWIFRACSSYPNIRWPTGMNHFHDCTEADSVVT
jgi:hypothetical protein